METHVSYKTLNLLGHMCDYQFVKKDHVPCSWCDISVPAFCWKTTFVCPLCAVLWLAECLKFTALLF